MVIYTGLKSTHVINQNDKVNISFVLSQNKDRYPK